MQATTIGSMWWPDPLMGGSWPRAGEMTQRGPGQEANHLKHGWQRSDGCCLIRRTALHDALRIQNSGCARCHGHRKRAAETHPVHGIGGAQEPLEKNSRNCWGCSAAYAGCSASSVSV